MKKIVLTGGGTAGHVTPNIALIPELQKADFEIYYIGSKTGIEKELIEELNIPYFPVETGKLRRYFDLENFTDPFRVAKGFGEAISILRKIQPDVLFSKGGFVSVPVVRAAHLLRIPCIIHESDMTPGLANKICLPVAKRVCVNFPETLSYIRGNKGIITGTPIRKELFEGNKEDGLKLCDFKKPEKPVLLVMGGSLGAVHINDAIRKNLKSLVKKFNIIHLCGKGNLDETIENDSYVQFEYVNEELKDIFAAADIVVSRAGANAICELLVLAKPALLIPLSAEASRGDQILNASSFKKQGFADMLEEQDMTDEILLTKINKLYECREDFIDKMKDSRMNNSTEKIMSLIKATVKDR